MEFFPEIKNQLLRISALLLITVPLFVYLGCSIRNLQYKLLYYPSAPSPDTDLLRANNIKLWQPSGADYRGLVAANETRQGNKGTVIVFHGNGGTAADRVFYLDALGTLGYRVVLAEYPMYGGRKGELGERSFVGDAKESIRLAYEEYGGPFFVLGESLGCGIAAAAAGETRARIDGIILITPWDTLEAVAGEKFPFLPVRLLLKDKYDNIGNLASFKGRIAVVGAGLDEVIPIAHATNLYNSLSSTSKTMWIFHGAGHNDWYMYADTAWWKEIMDFVNCKN